MAIVDDYHDEDLTIEDNGLFTRVRHFDPDEIIKDKETFDIFAKV